jgi:pheromone shutdown protein TraB
MAVSTSWTFSSPGGSFPPGAILLVGVAHVLDVQAGLQRVLSSFAPTAVAVELDPERAALLKERARERTLPPGQRPPARTGGPLLFRLWGHLQERLARDMGVLAGGEMLQVADYASRAGLPTYLVDDPLRETAPRLLASLSGRERLRLLLSTLAAFVIPTGLMKGSLEDYAEGREDLLAALRRSYPGLTRVLVDERNEHMAARLASLARETPRVAAALGDAHLPGVSEILRRAGLTVSVVHLEELAAPPPPPSAGSPSAYGTGPPQGSAGVGR